MPDLNFKGKQLIYAHHLGVPIRGLDLDKKKSLTSKEGKFSLDDNLIIQGDNLHALKALIPLYAGRVKCIYIDPPYNTGNETWVFNDNVNASFMKEWLNKEIGMDDLERHDKWLCMMWPRLQLLKQLLSDDGVLICAIDHNEREHLGLILKEIFADKEIVCVTIVHNPRGIQGHNFSYTHEYAYFVYPNIESAIGSRKIEEKDIKWRDFCDYGGESLRTDAKNCFYPIFVRDDKIIGFGNVLPEDQHPKHKCFQKEDTFEIWPIDKDGTERKWRYARQTVDQIKHLLKVTKRKDISIGKDFGSYRTVWTGSKYDSNEYGTKLLKSLIKDCPFNFPKSFFTVRECLQAVCTHNKDAVILDSFAGSGTTAHAVLDLNKEDGGHRKFILVECEDYADTITAERVRQVIKGVPKAKDARLQKGLGGSFTYCTLGEEITVEKMLTGENLPSYETLARYILYTATGGQSLDKISKDKGLDGLFYETQNNLYYLIYEPYLDFLRSDASALNMDRAEKIAQQVKKKKKRAIVYASCKYIGQKDLTQMGIIFCLLPYEILKTSDN